MDREEIITAFKDTLDECGIRYKTSSPRDGSIVLSFGMKLASKIPHVFASFDFRQVFIRIVAIYPGPLPLKNLTEMLRLIAMANQDMVAGCFAFEMKTRTICFRYFLDCTDFETLPPDLVRNTLLLPFQKYQRYGDAIVAVAEGSSDAATAFDSLRLTTED